MTEQFTGSECALHRGELTFALSISHLVLEWSMNVAFSDAKDRANQIVLDAFESAISKYGATSSGRHRIEHAQILTLDDIPRFEKLGGGVEVF